MFQRIIHDYKDKSKEENRTKYSNIISYEKRMMHDEKESVVCIIINLPIVGIIVS